MSKPVGIRIRDNREDKGLSLEELAEKADCPVERLEKMEQGGLEPQLGDLVRFSRVLGVSLRTFMDDILTPDPYIVREAELAEEVAGDTQPHVSQRYYSLGKGKAGRKMEPFYIILGSCPQELKSSKHDGEEFIIVVSGRVKLQYGQGSYELGPGDSVYYNSDAPHSVCAVGEKAVIYAVMHVSE